MRSSAKSSGGSEANPSVKARRVVKPRRRVRAVGPIVRRRAVATGGDGEGVADEVEEAEKRLKGAYEKSLNPPSLIHMIRLEKKWEKRNPPEQPSGWARDDDGVIDLVEGEDDDYNEEDPEASGSGSEVQGKGEEEEEVAEPSTPPRRGSYVPISFIAPHTPDFGPSGSLSRDAPSTPSESPVAAGAKSRESPFYMTRRVKRRLSELEASFDFWEGRALPCADLVSGESSVRSVLARILDVKGTTSSVCYMRETESKQEGMQLRKLPHIMYRMSYLEPESPASSSARSCVEKALFPARACVIQSDDDVAYREYVMWPSRRLEMLGENDKTSCSTCMADSIAAMRRHLRENSCVILHYRYRGGEALLEACQATRSVAESDLQICLSLKQSTTGTTEINRVAGSISKGLKLSALCLKLDLFISPTLAKNLSTAELSTLATVVAGFERGLEDLILGWNTDTLFHRYLADLERKFEEAGSGNEAEDLPCDCAGAGAAPRGCCLSLDGLLRRVNCLCARVGCMDTNKIFRALRADAEASAFIQKNSKFFCRSTTRLVVALVGLMYADLALEGGKDRECLYRRMRVLCRTDSRDSFRYEMLVRETLCKGVCGREFVKNEYFFPPRHIPDNYRDVVPASQYDAAADIYPAGVTTYTDLFSDEGLRKVEGRVVELEHKISQRLLPESCYDRSQHWNCVRRTKTFFGARYLWTKDQKSQSSAGKAGGIRLDVPRVPKWVREDVEDPLVRCRVVPENFINSSAVNIYHDGSEGIQSHYDDDSRFARPIVSLRLFSDSRLSFGTQFFGYVNGSFFVPMPRGCITVMEERGYAANGIKHSVRPTDMTAKSVAVILRHVHDECMEEAAEILMDETGRWFQGLGLEEGQGKRPVDDSQKEARAAEKAEADVQKVVRSVIRQVQGRVRAEQRAAEQREKAARAAARAAERECAKVERECAKVVKELLQSVQGRLRVEQREAADRDKAARAAERDARLVRSVVRGLVSSTIKEVQREKATAKVVANILKAVAGGRKYKFSSRKTGKATFYLGKKPEPWPEDAQNIVQKKS